MVGLLLATSPAFAQVLVGQDASASETSVNQVQNGNYIGNSLQTFSNDNIGSLGAGNIGITNSSGVISQSTNTGTASNVGSATNIATSGGLSERGGNTDIGNPNNLGAQLAVATLRQVNTSNQIGNSWCYGTNVYAGNSGVNNVGITGSTGVISQQVNAGISSNVGSATGVSIH